MSVVAIVAMGTLSTLIVVALALSIWSLTPVNLIAAAVAAALGVLIMVGALLTPEPSKAEPTNEQLRAIEHRLFEAEARLDRIERRTHV